MATFPRTEADLVELGQKLTVGLTEQSQTYPSPPVSPEKLQAALAEYSAASEAARIAEAEASERFSAKAAALENLRYLIKADLRYAEHAVRFDHEKLMLIGWGGRKPREPLQPPGQVLSLRALREGVGWLTLGWRKPDEGGKVAAYRIQLLSREDKTWHTVVSTAASQITLDDQPSSVELEYRVVAFNKAGEGMPSNSVNVVV